MTFIYQYVILDENFEKYACGQAYGGWTIGCDDRNDDCGGSGYKFIFANPRSGAVVRYVFTKPLRRFYMKLKSRLVYRSHQLGCYFDINIMLIFQGSKLLIRIRHDVCANKIVLQAVNPDTGNVIKEIECIYTLGEMAYGTFDSSIYYYYVSPYFYIDENGNFKMALGEEKTGTCTLEVDDIGTYQNLVAVEIYPSTDASTVDADLCVDDIYIESDTPVSIQLEYQVPQYVLNIFYLMMYITIAIVIVSLVMQLFNRFATMFSIGVSAWMRGR